MLTNVGSGWRAASPAAARSAFMAASRSLSSGSSDTDGAAGGAGGGVGVGGTAVGGGGVAVGGTDVGTVGGGGSVAVGEGAATTGPPRGGSGADAVGGGAALSTPEGEADDGSPASLSASPVGAAGTGAEPGPPAAAAPPEASPSSALASAGTDPPPSAGAVVAGVCVSRLSSGLQARKPEVSNGGSLGFDCRAEGDSPGAGAPSVSPPPMRNVEERIRRNVPRATKALCGGRRLRVGPLAPDGAYGLPSTGRGSVTIAGLHPGRRALRGARRYGAGEAAHHEKSRRPWGHALGPIPTGSPLGSDSYQTLTRESSLTLGMRPC